MNQHSTNSTLLALPTIRWPVPVVILIGLGLFTFGELVAPDTPTEMRLAVGGTVAGLLFLALVALWQRTRWLPRFLKSMEQHTDSLDALPDSSIGGWIALASGVGLFVELMLIRWQASTFQFFAYYKNISLLAAFLGLGIGYALGQRRPVLTPLVLPALGLQFGVLYLLRFSYLAEQLRNPVSEQLAFGLSNQGLLTPFAALSYGFLILTFIATVLTCLPLGHLASRLMLRRPPLVSYSWNLIGSLLGILLFSALSFLWSPPAVWLLVASVGIGSFLVRQSSPAWTFVAVGSAAFALTLLAMPLRTDLLDVYSPYQIVSLRVLRDEHPHLQVNHVYYQKILDLSAEAQRQSPELQRSASYYELPYQFQPRPKRVLVVGCGTGNDVAAGLRREAKHIDAVEIDPTILNYGRLLHPEKPYQDERVELFLDDARNFIRRTDRQYDLIVYGLLDSHTLLSGLSSVRLDSFVYTVEAFREARARLAPNGIISMTFSMLSPAQARKFFLMLQEAFDGQGPRVYSSEYDAGTTFVIGPNLSATATPPDVPFKDMTQLYHDATAQVDLSTDDWPFLYMQERRYPASYGLMVAILLLVSLLVLRQLMPLSRTEFSSPCFFLGAGFMLVETKAITELGLTLGNTWQVVSAVIASILVLAFLANLIILRRGAMPPALAYGLLAVSLMLGIFVPGTTVAGVLPPLGKVLATVLVTLPLFFSGFAFSSEMQRQQNLPAALSSNLLGAMLGGFLEYNSMYFGFRSLYFFALVLYGLAFVTALRPKAMPART